MSSLPVNLVTASGAPDLGIVLQAGAALGEPRDLPGHRAFAVIPKDYVLKELERAPADRPEQLIARPVFTEAVSFIAYVNRFKQPATQIFANRNEGEIVAVIDYHEEPKRSPDGVHTLPQHRHHIARLKLRHSPEWSVWTGADGKQMDQQAFAELIEDNFIDVTRPTSAEMLEVATNLHGTKGVQFGQSLRLKDGSTQITYTEEVTGNVRNSSLTVPNDFDLALAPYEGCSRYKVVARFRFRCVQARIALWYDLLRTDDILRDAFDGITKRIADETAIAVYLGVTGV